MWNGEVKVTNQTNRQIIHFVNSERCCCIIYLLDIVDLLMDPQNPQINPLPYTYIIIFFSPFQLSKTFNKNQKQLATVFFNNMLFRIWTNGQEVHIASGKNNILICFQFQHLSLSLWLRNDAKYHYFYLIYIWENVEFTTLSWKS